MPNDEATNHRHLEIDEVFAPGELEFYRAPVAPGHLTRKGMLALAALMFGLVSVMAWWW